MNIANVVIIAFMLFGFWLMITSIYMLNRNNWVYKHRTDILDNEGIEAYHKLPSYEAMLNRWWEWDINKFKNENG